jgi:hypothetical protein
MPSGARLVAAILMALALMGAVWLAGYHDPVLLDARLQLLQLAGVVGLFFGWGMLGRRLGSGFRSAASRSVATMVVAGFWFFALLAMFSVYRSLEAGLYRGRPVQAVEAVVERFWEFAAYAGDIRVIVAALVGALIAGLFGEYCRMIWN